MINLLGDYNQDGNLNIIDLVKIANLILDGSNTDNFDYTIWASDVNLDASINLLDLVTLVNIILENSI